jgi:hypothetical protein
MSTLLRLFEANQSLLPVTFPFLAVRARNSRDKSPAITAVAELRRLEPTPLHPHSFASLYPLPIRPADWRERLAESTMSHAPGLGGSGGHATGLESGLS